VAAQLAAAVGKKNDHQASRLCDKHAGLKAMTGNGRTLKRKAMIFGNFLPVIGILSLTGCFPMSDSSDSDGEAHLSRFANPGDTLQNEVNRSGKKDSISFGFSPNLGQFGGSSQSEAQGTEKLARASFASTTGSFEEGSDVIQPTPSATVALAGFYKALRELQAGTRTKPVTVIHLGDGHISSDRFSGDLRDQLQARFGNAGRGVMPPGPFKSRDVKAEAGGQWHMISSATGGAGPFGVTGMKFSAVSKESWLRLNSTEGQFDWADVTFETGPGFGTAEISVDGESKSIPCDGKAKEWKSVHLTRPGRELIIRPTGDGPITMMSWGVGANRPGVRYASLALRKASALTPAAWDAGLLAADMKRLEPDLIIVSYGSEEGMNDVLDADYYTRGVISNIAKLKQAAPNASLLVVGPPDASRMPRFAATAAGGSDACRPLSSQEVVGYTKLVHEQDAKLARWHPPLRLGQVRAALSRAAAANGSYFWDWSKVMGGPCGIHAWVHANPPLAAADHAQFTPEGSKRSAKSLFFDLMSGFDTSGGKTSSAAAR
jgi:hypothetical protein